MRNDKGEVAGVVLVFRDISERRRQEQKVQDALNYADNIIATLRVPFVVSTRTCGPHGNAAFYPEFHASKEETEGRFVYDLGNGQWDIPQLRELLPKSSPTAIPLKTSRLSTPSRRRVKELLLNARSPSRDQRPGFGPSGHRGRYDPQTGGSRLEHSEVRYRRLFQMAKDGILILDADTGKVIDANPFMSALLGYPHDEFLGKELWEIGLFGDIQESRAVYRELQEGATSATRICRWKAQAGTRSRSSSSATSMERTTTKSFNATSVTSPNAAASSD